MKNIACNRIFTLITFLVFASALLISCNKESIEINNNETVEGLVEQAAQQYLNTPVATGGDDENYSLNNSELPQVYLATSSGFDTKANVNPLIGCIKSVKPTENQVLEIRKALSLYEDHIQIILKNQREALSKMEERFIAAKKELMNLVRLGNTDRNELEKKIKALNAEFEKAVRAFREKNGAALSGPYKKLMSDIERVLDKRQWAEFSKCLSR
ncbi:MAG: hypothetical protein Q8R90_04350 [Bacteroidales bacterium]|jgi:hypothetical protein|nr:hypothetical protein [Bacteroidales bacterium]